MKKSFVIGGIQDIFVYAIIAYMIFLLLAYAKNNPDIIFRLLYELLNYII